MKYEIDLPELPEGLELVGHVVPQKGDTYLTDTDNKAEWVVSPHGFSHQLYITARKKRTLADWANEQELFQALAQIFCKHKDVLVTHCRGDDWIFDAAFMQRQSVALGVPPPSPVGKLKLVNGKWELA